MTDMDMRVFARRAGVNVTFPAGGVVFNKGNPGTCMYVVQSGTVEMLIGDKASIIINGNPQELAEKLVKEMKEEVYIEYVTSLLPLRDALFGESRQRFRQAARRSKNGRQ